LRLSKDRAESKVRGKVWAPEWHGRNLDAVWDSLTGGDINQRNPPLRIIILVSKQMGPDAKRIIERFAYLSGAG